MHRQIVISEDLWVELPSGFGDPRHVVYDASLATHRRKLLNLGPSTEALVVRNKTQVDEELLAYFPDLQVVGRLGVGLDNIDLEACKRHHVAVIAARGFNANAVAEYVMACLFQHARPLHRWNEEVRRGTWDRMAAMGTELHGKTLGLIGIGDIGQRVATRARSCGMRVIAHDPFVLPSHPVVQDVGVHLVSLEAVVEAADFVSIHIPLTPQTRGLLGRQELGRMRDDSVLIDTARGGIVDEDALAETLTNAPQRFAFLDVRATEPPESDDPLLHLPNVCLTPHIAGITKQSAHEVADFVLGQVAAFLDHGSAQGMVIP